MNFSCKHGPITIPTQKKLWKYHLRFLYIQLKLCECATYAVQDKLFGDTKCDECMGVHNLVATTIPYYN